MGVPQNISSLDCEVRIIRAKNLESISSGNLFVRYYLCTGVDNRRIRFNSREISPRCDPCWNESTSLECIGAEDALKKLKQQSIMFELRLRKTKFSRSKLLLRAEIGWNDVLDSTELCMEKWVYSASVPNGVAEGLKPPALQIGMKVRLCDVLKRNHVRSSKWNECGCRHGACNGGDDDIFAFAAALDVL